MIEVWLKQFKDAWENHDANSVVSLFSDNVEYWETPFQKLSTIDDVRAEWGAIDNQSGVELKTSIFSEKGHQFVVKWDLLYVSDSNHQKHWAGVYLITLNEAGKCTYFLQVGEQQT